MNNALQTAIVTAEGYVFPLMTEFIEKNCGGG